MPILGISCCYVLGKKLISIIVAVQLSGKEHLQDCKILIWFINGYCIIRFIEKALHAKTPITGPSIDQSQWSDRLSLNEDVWSIKHRVGVVDRHEAYIIRYIWRCYKKRSFDVWQVSNTVCNETSKTLKYIQCQKYKHERFKALKKCLPYLQRPCMPKIGFV